MCMPQVSKLNVPFSRKYANVLHTQYTWSATNLTRKHCVKLRQCWYLTNCTFDREERVDELCFVGLQPDLDGCSLQEAVESRWEALLPLKCPLENRYSKADRNPTITARQWPQYMNAWIHSKEIRKKQSAIRDFPVKIGMILQLVYTIMTYKGSTHI